MGRREEFLDITMKIVVEKGFGGFSMKQVTGKMGVSEALIYKYFETKEKLLYDCFESFHMRVAYLFKNFALPELSTPRDYYSAIRALWFTYFDFLVKGDYKTIYYFTYRDSPYISYVEQNDNEARNTYFSDFARIMHEMNSHIHFTEKVEGDYLWTYILDTSGIFAKRIIRGELPNTAESYEKTWQLISKGLMAILT